MVVTTGAVVVSVITAGAAAPAATGAVLATQAAIGGATIEAAAGGAAVTGAVVGSAVGTGMAAAAAGGVAAGAAAGASVVATAAGAAAGTAITTAGVAGTVGTGAAILSGPVGWLILGASTEAPNRWDCWRAVLREPALTSEALSVRMTLQQVAADARVARIDFGQESNGNITSITIQNIFGDRFIVTVVLLPCGMLALHAKPQ
jgi:hypothetical protein